MAMAGAVDNNDRVTMAAAMYNGEASAEDYGDRVEEVMGGGGSSGDGGRGLDKDNNDNGGDGSSNDERRRGQWRQRRQQQLRDDSTNEHGLGKDGATLTRRAREAMNAETIDL
jgi:hypothetical protein